MVNSHFLSPNESLILDTTNATVVIAVGTADGVVRVSDANDKFIADLAPRETITLPFNSGRYKLWYPNTAQWEAIVFSIFYVAV